MRFFAIATTFVFVAAGAVMPTTFAGTRPANHTVRAELPPLITPTILRDGLDPLEIKPAVFFDTKKVPESSGLARSSTYENVYWTLSDSENAPVVFALRSTGEIVFPATARENYEGIQVTGTRNIDWECLTTDSAGRLIVGDVGNNYSNRRNLCFYIVPEPNPLKDIITPPRKKISFYYPTQDEFPATSRNFDCESCFALNGQIYFFTKHWTNTETVLWRVDPEVEVYQAAVPVARFDVRGMVTDAALSPSHKRLAVLTYHGVWVFDLPPADADGKIDETKFFTHAPARCRRLAVPSEFSEFWQIEGVAFDDEETLLIAAEQGAIFRVPVSELE